MHIPRVKMTISKAKGVQLFADMVAEIAYTCAGNGFPSGGHLESKASA